jgi:GNAT superfamily N-acetyltransferase
MTIREATPADKAQVLALFDEFSILMHSTDMATQIGSQQYDEVMSDSHMRIFVAEENRRLLGLITLYLIPNIRHGHRRAHIEDVFVSATSRHGGVGTALFNAVKDFCRSQGVNTIKLDSGNELTAAHKFYEKHGGRTSERFFRFDL